MSSAANQGALAAAVRGVPRGIDRPGTVVQWTPGLAYVEVDGDAFLTDDATPAEPIPAPSLIGPVLQGQRVIVRFNPGGSATIVGTPGSRAPMVRWEAVDPVELVTNEAWYNLLDGRPAPLDGSADELVDDTADPGFPSPIPVGWYTVHCRFGLLGVADGHVEVRVTAYDPTEDTHEQEALGAGADASFQTIQVSDGFYLADSQSVGVQARRVDTSSAPFANVASLTLVYEGG